MTRPPTAGLAARLFGSSPEHALALMRAAWPAAVGHDLARRTDVVALERGVLRIRVPDAAWRGILFRMRSDILRRLRKIAGSAAPHSLGFVEGRLSVPADSAPPAAPAERPPLPVRPSPALVAAAEAIPDRELRARFLEAAGRYLARFTADAPDGNPGS